MQKRKRVARRAIRVSQLAWSFIQGRERDNTELNQKPEITDRQEVIQKRDIRENRTPHKLTEGVLVIARILTDPPLFPIIKDQDKGLLGFVYGGRETGESGIVDKTIFDAAGRELSEELFNNNPPIKFDIGPKNYIAKMTIASNHIVYAITIDLPPDTKLQAGEEQEAAFAVSAEKIEEYIEEGIFLPKHAKAWRLYQKRRGLQERAISEM